MPDKGNFFQNGVFKHGNYHGFYESISHEMNFFFTGNLSVLKISRIISH